MKALINMRVSGVISILVAGGMTTMTTAQAVFVGLGDMTRARDISADGKTVVGYDDQGADRMAVLWTNLSGTVPIGDLPGGATFSETWAVNADGSLIVGRGQTATGFEAVYWTIGGGIVSIGDLPEGPIQAMALGVSGDGTVIAGFGTSASAEEAFSWTSGGGMMPEGYLPDSTFKSHALSVSGDGSVIVGFAFSTVGFTHCGGTCTEAFQIIGGGTMEGLYDLTSDVFPLRANAASDDGSVIVGGGQRLSALQGEGFRWTTSGTTGIGILPGGILSVAHDVSADGSVIVGQSHNGTVIVPIIWDAGNGIRDLQNLLINTYGLGVELTDWTLVSADAISADGTIIAGYGLNPDGDAEAWIAALNGFPLPCPADGDGDSFVGIDEFLAVLAEWGLDCTIDPCTADANEDNTIGIDDFLKILADWGPCPS